MKTNLEELDKIINLDTPQLVLISGTNKIEKRFNISLVTDISLKQKVPTALFHNKEKVNLEDISYKFTDIRDKILSFKIKNCLVVIPCVSSYYDIKNRISNRKQKDVIYFDIQQY